jgi:hypothetical protein
MTIALDDLLAALELLGIVVGDAERLADVVDPILVGRRVVSAGCLVADRIGIVPTGVDVARGQFGSGFGVVGEPFLELLATGSNRGVQAPVLRFSGGDVQAFSVR